MVITYKQKCKRCNIKYVEATNRSRYLVCDVCEAKEMAGEITDPKMIKLFKIPDEFYKRSPFLRNIKIAYLKYGNLTEKQVEAFKNAVKKLKSTKAQ
ncbi:MAG: hypothetical protein ABIJ21_03945 [Nanoarchaeota archaeon]